MPELFREDELALFDSMEELRDKIAFFLDHPAERTAFAARGRARVLAEHRYADRMRALLDFAGERLPGFGKARPVAWPEHMPESLRQSVAALIEELALPATATFEDVIAAVRTKADRLSEAEAALLFLDEWRKLYLG